MSTTITVNGYQVEVFDFQHNSYAFIPTGDNIAWTVAVTQAQGVLFEEVNGRLATITSPEENTFIVDNISPFVTSQGNNYAWLGGYCYSSQWYWITGEDWTYGNWAVNEPNERFNSSRLGFYSGSKVWFDSQYDKGIPGYIIEFEGTGSPDDNFVGTDKNDTLDGGDGDDNILGKGGNDLLLGGIGNDVLVGSLGNDTLKGGDGNDELSGNAGDDRLFGDAGEDQLSGGVGKDQLFGDAGDDVLNGGADSDILNGGLGSNILIGGIGNDTYMIDSLTNILIEKANGGTDIIKASINYTLDNNIENLTLTGTKDLTGTGNELNNIITGNAANNILRGETGNDKLLGGNGNDTLVGGLGNDTLTGGGGLDHFRFESKNQGIDRITDFNNIQDKIAIKASGFGGGLTLGNLAADKFTIGGVGTVATTSSQRFIYNSDGKLFFDVDGNGSAAQTQIAIFNNPPFLSNSNFVII